MTPLFILWHPPSDPKFWQCLQYAPDDSALLFLAEAREAYPFNTLTEEFKTLNFYLLEDDVDPKLGLEIKTGIKIINYEKFVWLTEQHHPIITWK